VYVYYKYILFIRCVYVYYRYVLFIRCVLSGVL